MRRVSAFIVFISLANPALGGAWLREKGTGFSSLSASSTMTMDFSNTSYLEYGVRDDLTLGAEIGFTAAASGLQSGFATIFLRRPIGKAVRLSVWSYELGLGAGWTGDMISPHLKTGLSWGRGYDLTSLKGWVAVDASVMWDVYEGDHMVKIDSTIGVNLGQRFSGMLQVFHAGVAGDHAMSVAPSIVFKPLKSQPDIRIQVGAETQLGASQHSRFKFSLWREF